MMEMFSESGDNILELIRHGSLRVFVLKMLFVSLRIRHGGPADNARKPVPSSCSLGVIVLVVSCLFLQLGCFFCCLCLRLLSLKSTSHFYSQTCLENEKCVLIAWATLCYCQL
eukprot:TRINITY_DN2262_c0_g1_i2.p1 TRINITY_DN2262_c0_g1~~TRINITY_DN2262_c0_g1_i2.p1  ORF type:complete len:113 (-),score=5.51 TRINITY_DN2262_c0_g1_i2:14-352(-)